MLTTCGCRKSRLAQLVERKTLNLVVVGSSPTVGGPLLLVFFLAFCKSFFARPKKRCELIGVGFEPTPPKRLVP